MASHLIGCRRDVSGRSRRRFRAGDRSEIGKEAGARKLGHFWGGQGAALRKSVATRTADGGYTRSRRRRARWPRLAGDFERDGSHCRLGGFRGPCNRGTSDRECGNNAAAVRSRRRRCRQRTPWAGTAPSQRLPTGPAGHRKRNLCLARPAVSAWNWWRRRAAPTHVAVQLRSHAYIFAKDCRILVGRPEVPPHPTRTSVTCRTGENVEPGTLTDIQFEGVTFDFRDEFGPLHPLPTLSGLSGSTIFSGATSPSPRPARCPAEACSARNTRRRTDIGLKHVNIIQGIFARYEAGVVMRQISFDGTRTRRSISRAMLGRHLEDLQFRNGVREAQCIDTEAGDRWP